MSAVHKIASCPRDQEDCTLVQGSNIVLLRDFQEMTIGEIASALGITRAAAKSRLHRARSLVREFLTGEQVG